MLLALAQWLAQDVRLFNVFNYITLRTVLATMTALLLSFAAGPAVIRRAVPHDPVEPGGEAAPPVEPRNGLPRFEEGVHHHIRRLIRADDPGGDGQRLGAKRLEKFRERIHVALPGFIQQAVGFRIVHDFDVRRCSCIHP